MTKIIGILNITPDSFSDGGEYLVKSSAIAHLNKMIEQKVDIVDIGAESTRPGAKMISSLEEWRRLENILPDIIKAAHEHKVEVSLDSYHAENISKALDLGIDYINDVSGAANNEIIKLAALSGRKIIINHNLGIPADKDICISGDLDIVSELTCWFKNKITIFKQAGVLDKQIILDIGIGFGKTPKQSLELVEKIEMFDSLGYPIYVGHSRKSFLSEFDKSFLSAPYIKGGQLDQIDDRDFVTNIITDYLIGKVDYIRVHNVALAVGTRGQG
ncbi:MAG: dihydropteroate synthase [Rickettsiales bacterium]|jgi:dihydropteroate synthase|nr:dihydropteroate synthase [Rickettsiales bacterium]